MFLRFIKTYKTFIEIIFKFFIEKMRRVVTLPKCYCKLSRKSRTGIRLKGMRVFEKEIE